MREICWRLSASPAPAGRCGGFGRPA